LNLPLHHPPLSPSTFLEQFQQASHSHSLACVQGICSIFTSCTLSPHPTNSPGRTRSALRFLVLSKRRRLQSWLFKITTQGISSWHFHVYVSMHSFEQ
jgi:hypothetical protein